MSEEEIIDQTNDSMSDASHRPEFRGVKVTIKDVETESQPSGSSGVVDEEAESGFTADTQAGAAATVASDEHIEPAALTAEMATSFDTSFDEETLKRAIKEVLGTTDLTSYLQSPLDTLLNERRDSLTQMIEVKVAPYAEALKGIQHGIELRDALVIKEQELETAQNSLADLTDKFKDLQQERHEAVSSLSSVEVAQKKALEELTVVSEKAQSLEEKVSSLESERDSLLESNSRLSGEAEMSKLLWPKEFKDAPSLEALRFKIDADLIQQNPIAIRFLAYLQLFCLPDSLPRDRKSNAFSLGECFWGLFEEDATYDSDNGSSSKALANWVNSCLEKAGKLERVAPGARFEAKIHDNTNKGSGAKINRVLSFLLYNDDGSVYKKAKVEN